jgi:hypothetical protein
MVRLAPKNVACLEQRTFLVFDAYFASNVAFDEAAKAKDRFGHFLLTIIVRAKANFELSIHKNGGDVVVPGKFGGCP